ncbi:unnamed protein product [marine sediment metagenome]|uniref:Uncharacterized protein n=1 Tax=marine sediment metagenome TaxID=412755 RepID=X1L068_9ZZZZ
MDFSNIFAFLILFPHFVVMLLAVISFSVSISMVVLHKPKNWLLLHKFFASLGLFTSIIGLILLRDLVLGILHGILGLVSIILFAVVIVIGLVAIYKKGKNVIKIHIWLSRIIYILTLFLIVLGIMTFLFF